MFASLVLISFTCPTTTVFPKTSSTAPLLSQTSTSVPFARPTSTWPMPLHVFPSQFPSAPLTFPKSTDARTAWLVTSPTPTALHVPNPVSLSARLTSPTPTSVQPASPATTFPKATVSSKTLATAQLTFLIPTIAPFAPSTLTLSTALVFSSQFPIVPNTIPLTFVFPVKLASSSTQLVNVPPKT